MTNLKEQFLLRRDITYLNFGSFGACAKPIFKRYQEYQLELESEPVQFVINTGPQYLQQSREALGRYINADADDVVYVTNPSYAVNIVAKNFDLHPGDEVLATDIEYGACDRAWRYYCGKVGATYRRHPIRLPLQSKEDFIEQIEAGINDRTKLIFISHITSTTALCFPVQDVCTLAKKYGIPVFIDGAHAPGHIPLDMKALDVDYYTGACHKWMMTPKGCSFLYTKRALQAALDPLVVSWGYEALFPSQSQYLDYHQMQGSRDFSAFLTVPEAIRFMEENNWPAVSANCRKVVKQNAAEFCRLLNAQPLAPLTDDFILQMFSAEIKTAEPEKLQKHLFEEYRIEIPVMRQDDKVYLRYSINAFNEQNDLDRLFNAIQNIQSTTSLIQS